MSSLKIADFGNAPEDIYNNAGNQLYKPVTIDWQNPIPIPRDGPIDLGDFAPERGHLYILIQNHPRAGYKDWIRYVGITNDVKNRFRDHHIIKSLRTEKRKLSLSLGCVDWHNYRTGYTDRSALEEIEHILIWMLWNSDFKNSRKGNSLPGMGVNGGRSWDIRMKGRTFSGQMPERVVYPWALASYRRSRATK